MHFNGVKGLARWAVYRNTRCEIPAARKHACPLDLVIVSAPRRVAGKVRVEIADAPIFPYSSRRRMNSSTPLVLCRPFRTKKWQLRKWRMRTIS